jgi:antitoxin component YwqK of YwqJK toxin-antitoxin module
MKLTPFVLLLLATAGALAQKGSNAQKIERYYTYQWKDTDVAHARFYSVTEPTDSGWHRLDYYVHGPSLQMEGWYEDSACKRRNGKFTYAYPDRKIESVGRYLHGKKEGLWLTYHYNGMLADSTVYAAGHPIGVGLGYYPDGMPADSCIYQSDGSGAEVKWYRNGNPSSAGVMADFKQHGKWQYFHENGKLSALELYDHGKLLQRQYFDETGQPMPDTTNHDKKASFKGGLDGWLKYLNNHLYFPNDYKIVNSDLAAVVISGTIDEEGNVKDIYVSTPFYPPFEKIAIDVIRRSPKWQPAIDHNRRVESQFRQPVVFSQPND